MTITPELDHSEKFCKKVLTLDDLAVFAFQDPLLVNEEQKFLQQPLPELLEKYDTAVVIGRFQPLHWGHIYLMKQALRIANYLVVGIGSANTKNEDNPFPLETRQSLLQLVLQRETDIYDRITKIVCLNDYTDDQVWLQETLQKMGEFNIVVGNNEWVNGLFRGIGYKTIEIPLFRREKYEGRTIRESLRKNSLL